MKVHILHAHCGGHIFDYSERPVSGTRMESHKATLPDGAPIKLGDAFDYTCPHCGDRIIDARQVEPEGGYAHERPIHGEYAFVDEDDINSPDNWDSDKRRRRRQHRHAARHLLKNGTFLNPIARPGSIPWTVAQWHLKQARYWKR